VREATRAMECNTDCAKTHASTYVDPHVNCGFTCWSMHVQHVEIHSLLEANRKRFISSRVSCWDFNPNVQDLEDHHDVGQFWKLKYTKIVLECGGSFTNTNWDGTTFQLPSTMGCCPFFFPYKNSEAPRCSYLTSRMSPSIETWTHDDKWVPKSASPKVEESIRHGVVPMGLPTHCWLIAKENSALFRFRFSSEM